MAESLDAAWAEVEAVMPEGWVGPHLYSTRNNTVNETPYKAEAFKSNPGRSDDPITFGLGDTPASALLSLAEAIREAKRKG
jgi:hypothetical protein